MLMGQGKGGGNSLSPPSLMNRMEGKSEASEEGGREKGRMRRRGGGKIPQSAGQREGTRDNVHPAKDG